MQKFDRARLPFTLAVACCVSLLGILFFSVVLGFSVDLLAAAAKGITEGDFEVHTRLLLQFVEVLIRSVLVFFTLYSINLRTFCFSLLMHRFLPTQVPEKGHFLVLGYSTKAVAMVTELAMVMASSQPPTLSMFSFKTKGCIVVLADYPSKQEFDYQVRSLICALSIHVAKHERS